MSAGVLFHGLKTCACSQLAWLVVANHASAYPSFETMWNSVDRQHPHFVHAVSAADQDVHGAVH